MFKNSKDKEMNYISTEEVKKMYEFQKKSFDAKIIEQQKKVDELTDYISARFGENIAESNIASKLSNLEKNLKNIQDNYKIYTERTTKELTQQIKKENEKIAAELNDIQTESYFKLLQKNEKDLEKVQDTITVNKENGKKILELDEIVNNHIKNYEEHKKDVQKEFDETKKKLDRVNYTGITGKFDKKIKEECSKLKNKLEESNEQIKNDVIKQSEDIANLVGNLDERLSTEIVLINEQLGETINQTSFKAEKLTKNVTSANKKIDDANKNLGELKTKLEENASGLRTEFNESINKLKTELSENTSKLEKRLKANTDKINTNYETTTKAISDLDEKIADKVKILENEIYNEINLTNDRSNEIANQVNDLETTIKNKNKTLETKVKKFNCDIAEIQEFLNEQIVNSKDEQKNELDTISLAVDVIKNTMDENYEKIGQELLILKEDLEKQESNNTDIELLKKDYNKLITKMNSELAKISKSIMNGQKKNLEISQNLQVKIKTYVDNKIEKNNNIQKIEELINNLDISIQQREKAQRLEMEELMNKKLKAIQKENERILNKKIEEISSRFIRENVVHEKVNPNKVTFYTEQPKNKKNVYELIDGNQILRKTAKSKKELLDTQENKSQSLKFFYDEED